MFQNNVFVLALGWSGSRVLVRYMIDLFGVTFILRD